MLHSKSGPSTQCKAGAIAVVPPSFTHCTGMRIILICSKVHILFREGKETILGSLPKRVERKGKDFEGRSHQGIMWYCWFVEHVGCVKNIWVGSQTGSRSRVWRFACRWCKCGSYSLRSSIERFNVIALCAEDDEPGRASTRTKQELQ